VWLGVGLVVHRAYACVWPLAAILLSFLSLSFSLSFSLCYSLSPLSFIICLYGLSLGLIALFLPRLSPHLSTIKCTLDGATSTQQIEEKEKEEEEAAAFNKFAKTFATHKVATNVNEKC